MRRLSPPNPLASAMGRSKWSCDIAAGCHVRSPAGWPPTRAIYQRYHNFVRLDAPGIDCFGVISPADHEYLWPGGSGPDDTPEYPMDAGHGWRVRSKSDRIAILLFQSAATGIITALLSR